MRKTFLWCQVLALFFCLLSVSSTNTRADEPQRFQIGLDYASFREYADAAQSYVEIYYSFNRKQLEFVSTDEGLVATVLMQLSVSDEEGNEVINRMWNTMSRVEDAGDAKSIDYLIIDQVGINLKPGDYRIRLKATDVNSMAFGETILEAKIQEFSTQKLQLSDLQLAFSIEADTTAGRLLKAGQKIMPNPFRTFTHQGGMVYFYAELYNLKDAPGAKPEYELRYRVLDVTGKKMKDFGKQTKTKPGNSAVVMSGINIGTLAGGEYILEVEAKDKATGKMAHSTKKFVIIREMSEGELAAEEIKRFKEEVAYIATSGELDMFDDLNFTGKITFIGEFWKRRDPNVETPENEFKIEHYRRLSYATFYFSRTQEASDGWNTGQGRIYILYGQPDEIERNIAARGMAPWERWNYFELQGGVYFIFVDEDGYGVYRLVHSNHRGEIYNQEWEDRVKSGALME
ncbi:MAG: GWxTD domain-containing protein [Candidatus Zixiibacteriota bacterium]